MGARRVANGVTGLLIGLTGDPRPDDESVGVEDMPSAIALRHATCQQTENRENSGETGRVQCASYASDITYNERKKKKKKIPSGNAKTRTTIVPIRLPCTNATDRPTRRRKSNNIRNFNVCGWVGITKKKRAV